uniref:Uncharacterized protein n=1 Tax=Helianthus annuus TaxID=4232 RepID=A0A251V9N9_HELAN
MVKIRISRYEDGDGGDDLKRNDDSGDGLRGVMKVTCWILGACVVPRSRLQVLDVIHFCWFVT